MILYFELPLNFANQKGRKTMPPQHKPDFLTKMLIVISIFDYYFAYKCSLCSWCLVTNCVVYVICHTSKKSHTVSASFI